MTYLAYTAPDLLLDTIKIIVDTQAADRTRIAAVSGSVDAKWPPRKAPSWETSEPNPICRNPIAPEAVPAASGRTLIAPAAEFDITNALANITIICVPNNNSGAWLRPAKLKDRLSRLPANCNASPNQISTSVSGVAQSARKRYCRSDRRRRERQTRRHIRRWCGPS